MKTIDIFKKTQKFVWLKMALGAATTVVSVLLLVLFGFLGYKMGEEIGLVIMFLVWLVLVVAASNVVNYYVGYLLKAGHVAAVAEMCTTGQAPEDAFAFGVKQVKSRFGAANGFIILDRLVSGSVRELQRGAGKIGDLLNNIPGMQYVTSLVQLFIGIALGYIDECCLGWCFLNPQLGGFRSACDGVIIYFKNIKHLLKSAVKVTVTVLLFTLVCWLVPFLLFWGIFAAFQLEEWGIILAVVISFCIALFMKSAFIDSWMMIQMMSSYLEVAPTTEFSDELNAKLCKISGKFRKLFNKGQEEAASMQENTTGT